MSSKLMEIQNLKNQAENGADYVFQELLAKSDKLKESGENPDCTNFKFKIVLRKRPLLHKEVKEGELDCISNSETELRMHECKVKVDGITKYVQNSDFIADRVFGHTISTENIYRQLFQATLEQMVAETKEK